MAEEILQEIKGLIRQHTNKYVDQWKAEGKPVVGYFCPYMPPEFLLAAGALPLRFRGAGSEDSSLGDAYLSGRLCTYVRHVTSLVLDERYDFLDGEICLNTCDHVRRAADVLVKKSSIPWHGFVSVPRNPRESLYPYYRRELERLLDDLCAHLGTKADENSMREAIKQTNRSRLLLAEIDELRLEEKPKISGAEALSVHISSQVLPPQAFAEIAERLIPALRARPGLDSPAGRLMVVGAELDEPEFIEAIESQGAIVVADLLCFGSRSTPPKIDEQAEDPFDAIARAYFFKPSCARMIGDFPARWERIKETYNRAAADGLIFQRLMFCDPWGADQHNIGYRADREKAFPMLALTREYGIVQTGQIKTRVQAFLEKIEIARAQKLAAGGER
jgi:benzoyl-CoA reductase subunit C